MRFKAKYKAAYGMNFIDSPDLVAEEQAKVNTTKGIASTIAGIGGTLLGGPVAGAAAGTTANFLVDLLSQKQMERAEKQMSTIKSKAEANSKIGQDSTLYMAKLGADMQAKGQIEVEKDELHFRKIGSNYKLVADYNKSKTHKAGGEDVVVQEGDIIIPGKSRKKVMDMLDERGYVTESYSPDFTGIVSKLPKVSNADEAADGGVFNKENINTAMEIAPIGYNLGMGLFGDTEKANRRFINPILDTPIDNRQETKNELNQQNLVANENIQKNAGGNSAAVLGNINQLNAKYLNAVSGINNQFANQAQQIQSKNNATQNQANTQNLQLASMYDEIDSQNRAAKQAFLSEGFTNMSDYGQKESLKASMASRDDKLMKMEALKTLGLGTEDYEANKDLINEILGYDLGAELGDTDLIKKRAKREKRSSTSGTTTPTFSPSFGPTGTENFSRYGTLQ